MGTATLTAREMRDRQVFINAAFERNPAAGRAVAVAEGTATWREWRRGVSEGARPSTLPNVSSAAQAKAGAQAVTPAVIAALKIHKKQVKKMKRAKKAARVAAAAGKRETAAGAQLAGQFTAAAASRSLREGSRSDLAVVAASALGSAGHSPFHRASPRGAVTESAAAAGRVIEAAAGPPGYERQLAEATPDDLRRHLGARLRLVGEASDLRSPLWRDDA